MWVVNKAAACFLPACGGCHSPGTSCRTSAASEVGKTETGEGAEEPEAVSGSNRLLGPPRAMCGERQLQPLCD